MLRPPLKNILCSLESRYTHHCTTEEPLLVGHFVMVQGVLPGFVNFGGWVYFQFFYSVLEGHFTGRALPIGQVEVIEE